MQQLVKLADAKDWTRILSLKSEAEALLAPAADRAMVLSILGRAHWNLERNPWDLAESIRYARSAASLDDLGGLALKHLGVRLVTIGRYQEGRRILQTWLGRFAEWKPEVQAGLADVQYSLGYAARYDGDMASAELWYRSARESFMAAGDTVWASRTACALVQVLVRRGQTSSARRIVDGVPFGVCDAYRLKATVELLAAEGQTDAALATGDLASEHLVELDVPDPWELAELHLLLADLQFQAGNDTAGNMHAELAMDALRTSKRHDLYRAACLLLDYQLKEVSA